MKNQCRLCGRPIIIFTLTLVQMLLADQQEGVVDGLSVVHT